MKAEYKDEKGKKLRIWNGRGWGRPNYDKDGNSRDYADLKEACDHIFVCAHSVAEAVRMVNEVGEIITANEVKTYWSECWGIPMKDIKPEVGIWAVGFEWGNKVPKRIL